jgi:NAD(P)-dependent dehydrogenase (short-subunit alcohol dehydrogenase family)
MRLSGEHALITGSTSGIGRATAVRFAAEGAHVAVTGRDRFRGEEVVAEIAAAGGRAVFIPTDLLVPGAPESLAGAAVEALGSVSVLVNNAVGSAGDGPVGEVDAASWEATLRMNLVVPALLCRAVLPVMIAAGRGAILNVSSRAAVRGTPGHAAYTASKGGLAALTRSIAVDYAAHGVRCNTLTPGFIRNDRRPLGSEERARVEAMQLTRIGTATDVAHAAVYLASVESELVTGIDLPVDGGSTAARAARVR